MGRKKRKKVHLRWDKIVAMLTVAAIVVSGIIIYNDFHKGKEQSRTVNSTVSANASAKTEKKTICIDAGHGGNDSGAEYKSLKEKNLTLDMALAVKEKLEKKGFNVVMTRTKDEYVDLEERTSISNNANAVALVSIHKNDTSSRDSQIRGIESWIYSLCPKDSYALADSIHKKLSKVSGIVDRGVKTGTTENAATNYAINTKSASASCILELGFINNEKDNALINKQKDAIAQAIADGIEEYTNRTEK